MTLDEFFTEFYWPLKVKQLRECTLNGYESAWRVHIKPAFGDWELNTIKAREIEKWIVSFPTSGVAKKCWAVLRTILRTAVKYDYLENDPTTKVTPPPKREKYIPDTLSKQEVHDLIKGLKGSPVEAWILVAATTGLRKEESAALFWSDIDLDSGAVIVNKGAQWINGREIFNPPKTLTSYRTVYLPDFALQRLRTLYKVLQLKQDARLIGKFHAGSIGQKYKRDCIKRGLPYVPPRNLRHTWATIALEEGLPLSIVSRCLGHYDVSTTARYYISPRKEDLIQASYVYDRAICGKYDPQAKDQSSLLLLEQIKAILDK